MATDEEIKNLLLIDELQSKVDSVAKETNHHRIEFKELKEAVRNNTVVYKAFEKSFVAKKQAFVKVEQELQVQ
jgi:hypothetical protein